MWMGRSCIRNRSAIPPAARRASSSSYAIGSSETLPLRHHQRPCHVVEEQVMERRVGQHHPEVRRARRHRRCDVRVRPTAGDDDWAGPAHQQFLLGRAQLHQVASGGQIGRHQRKGLVLSMLPLTERRHGLFVIADTGEVITAESLDGNDRSGDEGLEDCGRVGRQRRPAGRTRVRLRVEAPVARVLVLGPARVAHGKAGHRGERPVVRDAAHDREARPAVRAVDERIAVAAIRGIEQLAQAVVAGRAVGRDRRVRLAAAPCSPRSRSRGRRSARAAPRSRAPRPRAAAPRPAAGAGSAPPSRPPPPPR